MKKLLFIHFVSLVLASLDLYLFIAGRISFRGQWADITLSILPFITAVIGLSRFYKNLNGGGKVYFVLLVILNLLCTPLYLLSTVFYPHETYDSKGSYEARERSGVLAPPAVNLISKYFIFEKIIGYQIGFDPPDFDLHGAGVKIVFKGDSVGLRLPSNGQNDTYQFFLKR